MKNLSVSAVKTKLDARVKAGDTEFGIEAPFHLPLPNKGTDSPSRRPSTFAEMRFHKRSLRFTASHVHHVVICFSVYRSDGSTITHQ